MPRQRHVVRDELIKACQRYARSEQDDPHAHYDAELEYCDDMIAALAAELIAPVPSGEVHEKLNRDDGALRRWLAGDHHCNPDCGVETPEVAVEAAIKEGARVVRHARPDDEYEAVERFVTWLRAQGWSPPGTEDA